MSLIEHVEQIVEQAEDSKFSVAFCRNMKPHTDYIEQTLELTPIQAILISLFINKPTLEAIHSYCQAEQITKTENRRRIDFDIK